tara:strand:- start:784 stop:2025 length:1242 start_codon:yes stop_codon:yes gene_type:complete
MIDPLGVIQIGTGLLATVPLIDHWWRMRRVSRRQKMEPQEKTTDSPIVVVLPIWNEEKIIQIRLENLAHQQYAGNWSLMIVDSASTDASLQIIDTWLSENPEEFANIPSIVRMPQRLGKTAAVNVALDNIDLESIVVLTDADVLFPPDSLGRISHWFGSDPTIGAVSGAPRPLSNRFTSAERNEETYRRFYIDQRVGESLLDSTPISEGSLLAFRRDAIGDSRLDMTTNADDSQLSVMIRRTGLRSIFDSKLVFQEHIPTDSVENNQRSIRRARGLQNLFWMNRDLWLSQKEGPFNRIFRRQAWIHLIAPVLVTISFMSMFAHIALTMVRIQSGASVLIGDLALAFMSSLGIVVYLLGDWIPLGRTLKSYLRGQSILMRVYLDRIIRRNAAIWKPTQTNRDALLKWSQRKKEF